MYIAARAGPIDEPTIRSMVLIPIVTPVNSIGVDRIVTFTAPTDASDNPVDNTARPTEMKISVEWNKSKIENPAAVNIAPKIIGLMEPIFDMINPEVGPKTNKTMANGSCIIPVLIAFSPNPIGCGVCTKIGTV